MKCEKAFRRFIGVSLSGILVYFIKIMFRAKIVIKICSINKFSQDHAPVFL